MRLKRVWFNLKIKESLLEELDRTRTYLIEKAVDNYFDT